GLRGRTRLRARGGARHRRRRHRDLLLHGHLLHRRRARRRRAHRRRHHAHRQRLPSRPRRLRAGPGPPGPGAAESAGRPGPPTRPRRSHRPPARGRAAAVTYPGRGDAARLTVMTRVLYRGGRIHSPTDPHATALLTTDGVVTWLGPDADAPPADRTVPLDGCLVTPAFVDAHVHLTQTGLAATGLDLSSARSAADLLGAVAAAARDLPSDAVLLGHGWDESAGADPALPAAAAGDLPSDAVVLGHGWDESTWADPSLPDAAALDRAAGGRMVYLSQASMHSALCSAALASTGTGHPGYHPSGWLRQEAHHVV